MREIKFRGISTNVPDLEGQWITTDEVGFVNFFYALEEGDIKEDTVGEKTGLKDKNGTEIYEGDIVKGEYNGIVLYSNEMAMFAIVTRGDWESWIGFEDTSIYSIEIIGNIYENPELIDK